MSHLPQSPGTQTTGLDPTSALAMLNAVRAAIPRIPDADDEAVQAQHWLATKALGDMKPANAVEAMLAAQAAAAHFAAMDAYRQASDTKLAPELVHVLRRGANATARLAVETAQILDYRRSLRRGRIRTPDVLGRAVTAGFGAAASPSAAPVELRETARDTASAQRPAYPDAVTGGQDPVANMPHPAPIPPNNAAQTKPRHDPMHLNTQRDAPAATAGDPHLAPSRPDSAAQAESRHNAMHQNAAADPGGVAAALPAWLGNLQVDAFTAHLATLSAEELLTVMERLADLSQVFPDIALPDRPAADTAVA